MLARAMPPSNDSFFQSIVLKSEAETEAFGRRIADVLRPGDTVTLSGPLGAGKTVLARGLIRKFLPGEEVPSPTFTLVQTYDTATLAISHADLYRLTSPRDVRELGLEEALERGVLVIEWPDRMGDLLPRDRLDVVFEGGVEEGDARTAKAIARGAMVARARTLAL